MWIRGVFFFLTLKDSNSQKNHVCSCRAPLLESSVALRGKWTAMNTTNRMQAIYSTRLSKSNPNAGMCHCLLSGSLMRNFRMNCLLFVVRFVWFCWQLSFSDYSHHGTALVSAYLCSQTFGSVLQLWSLLATLILVSSVLFSLSHSLTAFARHSSSFSFLNMKQYAAPAKLTFHCAVAQLSLVFVLFTC